MNQNLDQAHSRLGFCFGGILQRDINKNSSLQTELGYSLEGSLWGQKLWDIGYDGNSAGYTLHYLRMSFKYERTIYHNKDQEELQINAGISLAYLLGATQNWVIEAPSGTDLDFGPLAIGSEMKKFDYGPFISIVLPHSPDRLAMEIRYYYGLASLYNTDYPLYTHDFKSKSEFKNRSMTIAFMYKI